MQVAFSTAVWFLAMAFPSHAWAEASRSHQQVLRLIDEGNYVEARETAARAVRLSPAGSRPCELAALYFDQGVAEHLLAQFQEAAKTFASALELCGNMPAATPRFLAALLAELGEVHTVLGRFTDADRELHRALRLSETLPSAGDALARVYSGLGLLQHRQGLSAQAERNLERSIAILEATLGPRHPDVAALQLTLAGMLLHQSRASEALPLAETARRTLLSSRGAAHPDTLFASMTLAVTKTDTAPAEAEALLWRALSDWRSHLPENHPTVMNIWNGIGMAQLAQGRAGAAADSLARALEIARNVTAPEGEQIIRVMFNYARSLKAARRKKEAAAMFAAAGRMRRALGLADPPRYTIDIRSVRKTARR